MLCGVSMPKILSRSHAAKLLSTSDYTSKGYTLKKSNNDYLESIDMTITYDLLVKNESGCLTLTSDNNCIANITFKIPEKFHLLDKCIQIDSAFIQEEFRRLSIGPSAYLNLLDQYNIISDTEQTEAGVHLWRSKLARDTTIDLYVVKDFNTSTPVFIKDKKGNPVLYKYDRTGCNLLDPKTWGYEEPDPRMISNVISPEINASMKDTREDVVLVATKR